MKTFDTNTRLSSDTLSILSVSYIQRYYIRLMSLIQPDTETMIVFIDIVTGSLYISDLFELELQSKTVTKMSISGLLSIVIPFIKYLFKLKRFSLFSNTSIGITSKIGNTPVFEKLLDDFRDNSLTVSRMCFKRTLKSLPEVGSRV